VNQGSFTDITLNTDASLGFPLSCAVALPSVSDGCTAEFYSYYIDQSTLPSALVHIDSVNSLLVFDQPDFADTGDYMITVTGFIPSQDGSLNDIYFQTSFTFSVFIRQAGVSGYVQTCEISCA
jgi:hypothetical protein